MYYIAGWLLNAIYKESTKRGRSKMSEYLDCVHSNCSLDRDVAISCALPCGKVDRLIAYGGLHYSSADFYHFVLRVEKCFERLLTNENFIIHGPTLNNLIRSTLRNNRSFENHVFLFVKCDVFTETISDVYAYILRTYSRMRGKEIARRIMGHKMRSLKLHTRQKVAAATEMSRSKCEKEKSSVESSIHSELMKATDESDSDSESESNNE